MVSYWNIVEIVYVLDAVIFGFLALYFASRRLKAVGEARVAANVLTIIAGVLFFQELYFGLNTAADPAKLALLPKEWFPSIQSIWLFAKVILTFAGLAIILTIWRLKSKKPS